MSNLSYNDLLKGVKRLSKPERARWLDNLIKIELQRATSIEEVDKMFDKVRELQVDLGLRLVENKEFPWFLDATRPMLSRISSTNELVLPGSWSMSRKHLELKLNVFKRIEREFSINLNANGLPDSTGYGHDVSRLLSISGLVPKKIGVRPTSNLQSRAAKGLKNNIGKDFHAIIDDFLVLMYGCTKLTRVRFEDKSQSGLPLRSYGRGYKILGFRHAVDHLDEVLRLCDNKEFDTLLNKYDILFCYLMGSRRQPDAGGKRRYITSEAGRLQGLAADELVDNSVNIDGIPHALTKHFARMRFRMVWGGNIIANGIVNAIGSCGRDTYGKYYDFTFKHHGSKDILNKFKTFVTRNNLASYPRETKVRAKDVSVVAIDVTQFDGDYPRDILLHYCDFFKNTPIYNLFKYQMFGSSVQLMRDEDGPDFPDVSTDPLNPDFTIAENSGMPSGWSWVSDVGKIMAVVVYYSLQKEGLLSEDHSPSFLDSFLKGECNYAVLNLGDDNVILGPPGMEDTIMHALNKWSPWLCEVESGARFIGHIISVDDSGYLNVHHDPSSYLTNMLTPERGITSSFRRFWAHGWVSRKDVYLDAPISTAFHKVLREEWKKIYGSDLDRLIEIEASKQRELIDSPDELDGSDDHLRIIRSLTNAVNGAPDKDFALHVLQRYIADHSVLSWEFSRDDLLEKVGIDLYDLEGRPDISYSEKIMERSGYKVMKSNSTNDSSHVCIHKRLASLADKDAEWSEILRDKVNFVKSHSNMEAVNG